MSAPLTRKIQLRWFPHTETWKEYLFDLHPTLITQGYPKQLRGDMVWGRIRKIEHPHHRGIDALIKYLQGEERIAAGAPAPEREWEVPALDGSKLLKNASDQKLSEHRWSAEYNGHSFCVDELLTVQRQPVSHVTFIEMEFVSVSAAHNFIAPEWFGRDIARQHKWSHWSLCTKGVPASI